MNYQKIHDDIISRAKSRVLSKDVYVENHHIIPICEGGLLSGETINLLPKEHRLIHKLRYKNNGIVGNILAYYLMCNTSENRKKHNKIAASVGAKAYHKKFKEKNSIQYLNNERNAGVSGGNKCKNEKLGFLSFSEQEMIEIRKRGTETVVKNKLGMFSDEYREKHKITLQKKINTPAGIFNSMTEAAIHYNVSRATLTY